MQFLDKITRFITAKRLLEKDKKVLIAVSGGGDSVALLLALQQLGYRCVVAHCNFHLRGEESMRDERFVRNLCAKLGVELYIQDFDVPAHVEAQGVSVEMACRELRYAWFERLRNELECIAVAVAHHGDDNIETFFLNALRGTGIAGLAGMHPKNGFVVRPFLCVSRREVMDFLAQMGQNFVTDSSNLENKFKRNKLRNVVLPALNAQFPGCNSMLNNTLNSTLAGFELYAELIACAKKAICIERANGGFDIKIDNLMRYDNRLTLLFEIMKPLGFNYEQCTDVMMAIEHGNGVGKSVNSSSHTLTVGRHELQVLLLEEKDESEYPINLKNKIIEIPIEIVVECFLATKFSPAMVNGKNVIALDFAVLQCSKVVLRHWRNGDRFRPYGMSGTKLVSDLFTDMKLGEREKRAVWLLEADGNILWVVGYRAAGLFKVSPASTSFLLLSCKA